MGASLTEFTVTMKFSSTAEILAGGSAVSVAVTVIFAVPCSSLGLKIVSSPALTAVVINAPLLLPVTL